MKKVKIQSVIAAGFLAGIWGGVFALAASHMGQKDFNRLRFESEFYQRLHRRYFVLIGAGLGFGLGAAQCYLVQLSKIKIDPERDDI